MFSGAFILANAFNLECSRNIANNVALIGYTFQIEQSDAATGTDDCGRGGERVHRERLPLGLDVDNGQIAGFMRRFMRQVYASDGTGLCLASWFGPFRQFVLAHPWDVEGLGNIHPVVVAAVGMWKSLLSDFQGLWEGWENSFIVFPSFP